MSARGKPDAGAAEWRTHTVTDAEAGETVQQVLLGPMQLSRRLLQKLTRGRAVHLNRRPAYLARAVRAGDVIAVRIASTTGPAPAPVAMALNIVFEDDELLVVDKPAGLLVHPTRPEHTRTLVHGLAAHMQRSGDAAPIRPVHRLDRDTSGLLIVAKTAFAHQHLDRQLREGGITREYLALAAGVVESGEGTIDAPIGRRPGDSVRRAVRPSGDPAVTHYVVESRLPAATLLRLRLETGRTHQIRVHLAHIGHPVIGDAQYGTAAPRVIRRQALHAAMLRFVQPTAGEAVRCEAPLPGDMEAAIEVLRAE